jgi:c-di-GMP-specific phosphodiesterase
MSAPTSQHRLWDASTVLEALGAAETALWTWEPDEDRMRFSGAAKALGLGPLAPECSSTALRVLVLPHERALADDFLRAREPGTTISVRMTMRGGGACLWRGVWLEDGVRASGVVALEARFAPSDVDSLTGLLARRSFLAAARERLQRPMRHMLISADLDRLSRLNDALGHERADLVLAALGSRLAAAFPVRRGDGPGRRGRVRPAGRSGRLPGAPPRPCARRWRSRCASPASTSTRPCRSGR